MKATSFPSGAHCGDSFREAPLSGPMSVMSPLSVAMVKSWWRDEMTARLPEGERSKLSASFVMVTTSVAFSFSSETMSTFTSLARPVAVSSFHRPKSASYTITLPSLDIDG